MNWHTLAGNRVLGAIVIAIVLQVLSAWLIDGYDISTSLRPLLVISAFLAIASIGQTLVIILGGIDLSIPFVMGFANVVAAQLYGQGVDFTLICLLVGALALLIGAVNGALSSILKIHPLIITLGIGTMVQGSVLWWTGGFPSGSAPDAVSEFVSIGASLGPIPLPGLIPAVIVLAVAVALMLSSTAYGRRLYAIGGNPGAARYALISPAGMWIATFALSAFFAAMAGILLLGFTGSAYGDVGQPYLFQTIAAVVIGGTALVGGRGSYIGTIAGSLVLVEINTLLIGLGLQPSMVQAALGAVIIALVSLYGRESHIRTTI